MVPNVNKMYANLLFSPKIISPRWPQPKAIKVKESAPPFYVCSRLAGRIPSDPPTFRGNGF